MRSRSLIATVVSVVVAPAFLAIPISAILFAAPAGADDVYLENGKVFEDVLARVEGDVVSIRLSFGSVGVPLESVARIERSESSLTAFGKRRAALAADPAAGPSEWIGLARWAWQRGNRHGAREAALVAADLDPRAEGLEELMPRFDLVFEPQLGRWVSVGESMKLKGYRLVDGQWLSPEQEVARAQAAADAVRAREAEEESRLTRAVLAMAVAQMAREPEPREPEVAYGWPVAVFPGPFIRHHPSPHKFASPHHDPTAIPLTRRQPGSLFPVAPSPRAHRPRAHHDGRVASPRGGSPSGSSRGSEGR